ncbi:hypothetical protein EVAR_99905_1 [Eumeta japonica]|uniref:Uncharacterized protein n=1 Tax=Eumeta variegata TaxID=151549 RepID=A0A4C1ZT04_EUMVA|nr:hypothetical protein EVAR_99905_1 [Eumeta japonica]
MPRYYTWNATTKKFQRRKQGNAVLGHPGMRYTDALGRIYTVHPKNDEYFYSRLLLIRISSRNPDLEAREEVQSLVKALLLIEDMCARLFVRDYLCVIRHYGSKCFFWHSGHIDRRLPYGSFSVKITLKPSNY